MTAANCNAEGNLETFTTDKMTRGGSPPKEQLKLVSETNALTQMSQQHQHENLPGFPHAQMEYKILLSINPLHSQAPSDKQSTTMQYNESYM